MEHRALQRVGGARSTGSPLLPRSARPCAPRRAPARSAAAPQQLAGHVASPFAPAREARSVRARALTPVDPNPPMPTMPAAVQVATEGVTATPVTKEVTLLRGSCRERLKYEIEYALKRGTTENAYLINVRGTGGVGSGGTVLVDVPFKAFEDDFVACLEKQTDLARLNYVLITHMGPNRIPALAKVLARVLAKRPASAPKLQLVISNPLVKVLEANMSGDNAELLARIQVVPVLKEADVEVGPGHSLKLICTPTPRWPDLMVVYDPVSKVVFTSKLYSAHVAPSLVSDEAGRQAFDGLGGWDAYGEHWRYFFDCMLAPVAKQASAALDKLPIQAAPRAAFDRPAEFLSSLGDIWNAALKTIAGVNGVYGDDFGGVLMTYAIAPQHGPVVRASLGQLVKEYDAWAAAQVEALDANSVAVMYASAYGNTAALAQAISRGVTKGGVAVNTVNLELATLDEVVGAVKSADGFVIGSPTLGGHMPTQVQLALGSVLREPGVRGLPCGVFGSFGWSGEAVDEMEGKLKDGGFGFAFDSIRVKFKPSPKDLMQCEQAGRDLAVQVKRRLKMRERGATASSAAMAASGAQLAMGRVVGSLCVVAARDEDASNAMLASWVSQASFEPPGVTVAVKKDRGLETMLTPGKAFAMSMLAESKYKLPMKLLSKPHAPGEDRLAGLEVRDSPASGCPVLVDASAHIDCEVVTRMDAADHWIVYAKVIGGAVDNDALLTAVHHRKVGNHY
ncbi:MAG: flavodoxin-like protein [Monoraphidium minutum]|nr:MAG: flavodoxin-like protein [Monoraphidium minutum]